MWVENVPSMSNLLFVLFGTVIVWYELHLPSIAERMVSISVPSCHGFEQASISYHNPIIALSRPISLSASQSETLLPVWFVQPVPLTGCSYVPISTLTVLNWNHCYRPASPQSQEVMLWTRGLGDGYENRYKIIINKKTHWAGTWTGTQSLCKCF